MLKNYLIFHEEDVKSFWRKLSGSPNFFDIFLEEDVKTNQKFYLGLLCSWYRLLVKDKNQGFACSKVFKSERSGD